MVILFLHGLESTPGGKKPNYFLEHGHKVLNPALPADDFERSLVIAQAAYDEGRPELVVGSSRGGAVALNIETGTTPRLLICPAWKKWGRAASVSGRGAIMHSRQDEVIPYEQSQELAAASCDCRLVEAGADHRMVDADTLALMLQVATELVGRGELAS